MKQRRISLLLICVILLATILFALPTGVLAVSEQPSKQAAMPHPPYTFSVDEVSGGSVFSSSSMIFVYENFSLAEGQPLTLSGWIATDEGIRGYEYAWVSGIHRTPEWKPVEKADIFPREDLNAAGIPYASGHQSAGFSITVQPESSLKDGYYDLYIRAVSGDGIGLDIVIFNQMCYGTPDKDDGETRCISFPRLAKTSGALQNASITEDGLVISNTSLAALGDIRLSDFMQIQISYSVSRAYIAEKQPLIGFKSSPDHLYGDGKGQYNLTDHVLAIPLDTSKTERQSVTVNFENTDMIPHSALYLAAYLEDGVNVTIHDITLTYRGMAYDRTAAKIYFSSDVISYFEGINQVTLNGVTDPVMGDVLRIEVSNKTNDPFTHFNAWKLLNQHDLRLSADDYKYMVVLARANPENLHSHMTFYLCAGTIFGATEACTYTHALTVDGKWHYYVFDLTATENWKSCINGWRFDIISGDSLPGNYVDFASIQFFRTPEAAAKAASASVTQNVTPHAIGMPSVMKDDIEEQVSSDLPVIFEDGDWFVETQPEAETETTPIELPEISSDTEQNNEILTESVPDSTTQAEIPTPSGCTSVVSTICLLFALFFAFIIRKNKTEDTV